MRYCEKCGSEIPDGQKFCSNCGTPLINANPFEEIIEQTSATKDLSTKISSKNWAVCLILLVVPLLWVMIFSTISVSLDSALFSNISVLGGLFLGAHQFYVGKIKMGIFFTLTVGGFLVGAILFLIELTVTKTFKDVNGFTVVRQK